MTIEQKINEMKAARTASAENACKEFSKMQWIIAKALKGHPALERAMDAIEAYIQADIAIDDFLEGNEVKV